MLRHITEPRENWQEKVEKLGFLFHTTQEKYWDESRHYSFKMEQIEVLEAATNKIWSMYIQAVEHVIKHDLFAQLGIPEKFKNYIISTWEGDLPSIYGRFDFVYDGVNPPKLLEFNADTPTSLFEAAIIQYEWLKDVHPSQDQFNSIHDKLKDYWNYLKNYMYKDTLYFACLRETVEDYMNIEYLRDTAIQAGLNTEFIYIDQLGWDKERKVFIDMNEKPIRNIFKLYPWEWMFTEEYADFILEDESETIWIEPAWKALMSNKAMLAILWELFPNDENLLETYFTPDKLKSYAKKPIFSREGANVTLVRDGKILESNEGAYGKEGFIFQQLCELPKFGDDYTLIGSWVVGQESAGIGVRESNSLITNNTSRFVPHFIEI